MPQIASVLTDPLFGLVVTFLGIWAIRKWKREWFDALSERVKNYLPLVVGAASTGGIAALRDLAQGWQNIALATIFGAFYAGFGSKGLHDTGKREEAFPYGGPSVKPEEIVPAAPAATAAEEVTKPDSKETPKA